MSTRTITSSAQGRKQRALTMLTEVDTVRPAGMPWLWAVRSQRHPDRWYAVDTKQDTCNCLDSYAHQNGIPCKHKQAVRIWQLALDLAPSIAESHHMTLEQLETRLLHDLAGPVPEDHGNKLVVVLHAAQHLITEQEAAEEQSRTIELDIIPAHYSPTHEELLADILVHGKPRDPGDWTPATARARLAKAGYQLVETHGPGTTVRAREIYRKAA